MVSSVNVCVYVCVHVCTHIHKWGALARKHMARSDLHQRSLYPAALAVLGCQAGAPGREPSCKGGSWARPTTGLAKGLGA